jgi:hypothetical protein
MGVACGSQQVRPIDDAEQSSFVVHDAQERRSRQQSRQPIVRRRRGDR